VNNNLSDFIFTLTIFDVIKWFLVVGLLMYLAFAVVIIRQVSVMSEAIPTDPHNALVKIFAWAHLGMTILLLIVAAVVL
jgi:hypothetical protein